MALNDNSSLMSKIRNFGRQYVIAPALAIHLYFGIGCGGDDVTGGVVDGGNGHIGNGLKPNEYRLNDGKTIATLVFPKDADDNQLQTKYNL